MTKNNLKNSLRQWIKKIFFRYSTVATQELLNFVLRVRQRIFSDLQALGSLLQLLSSAIVMEKQL